MTEANIKIDDGSGVELRIDATHLEADDIIKRNIPLSVRIGSHELKTGECTYEDGVLITKLVRYKPPIRFKFKKDGPYITFHNWYGDEKEYNLTHGICSDKSIGWRCSSSDPRSCPRVLLRIEGVVCVLKDFSINTDHTFEATFVGLDREKDYDKSQEELEEEDHFYKRQAEFLETVQESGV